MKHKVNKKNALKAAKHMTQLRKHALNIQQKYKTNMSKSTKIKKKQKEQEKMNMNEKVIINKNNKKKQQNNTHNK